MRLMIFVALVSSHDTFTDLQWLAALAGSAQDEVSDRTNPAQFSKELQSMTAGTYWNRVNDALDTLRLFILT